MKRYAYQVTASSCPKVKVGDVLIYTQSRGPTHSEFIVNTKTFEHVGGFSMEKVATCWVVGGVVQFEQPPAKPGVLTDGIRTAIRQRRRELKAARTKTRR